MKKITNKTRKAIVKLVKNAGPSTPAAIIARSQSPLKVVHTNAQPAQASICPPAPAQANGKPQTPAPVSKKTTKPEKLGPLQYLRLPADAIRAALLCAGKDDVRFYLNGIHVVERQGEIEIVATNGHALLVVGIGKVKAAPAWVKDGVTFGREVLEHVGRLQKEGDVQIGYGKGHTTFAVQTLPEWATLKGKVLDGKYPLYTNIMGNSGAVLDGREGVPLTVAGFNPAYVKMASTIAGQLGGQSLHVFQGTDKDPAVITFGSDIKAALYLSAMTSDAIGAGTAKLLSPALARSAAAIRAHITRAMTAAKTTDEKVKTEAEARVKHLEQRLALVLQATGKQLEDKSKATATAAH